MRNKYDEYRIEQQFEDEWKLIQVKINTNCYVNVMLIVAKIACVPQKKKMGEILISNGTGNSRELRSRFRLKAAFGH